MLHKIFAVAAKELLYAYTSTTHLIIKSKVPTLGLELYF